MNPAELALRRASEDLDQFGRQWALIGGFALAARVEPRFTRDVDIAVAVNSDEEAEATVFKLAGLGYEVGAVIEQEATERMATARLRSPVGDGTTIFVDLLFSSSGIEPEIVRDAERIEVLPGLRLPVARIGHLIAIKLLATSDHRPQDAADLRNLREVADETELKRARTAVELIAERGYSRSRDLLAALNALQ